MGGTQHGAGEVDERAPYVPGDPIAIREIWNGRVWYARPATVVRDEPNLTMLHVPPRVICQEPVAADGSLLRIPTDEWSFTETERSERSNLSFAFPDTPYSVILGFDEHATLDLYYVNLQTPLVRSSAGFDTVEHILDVTIPVDRSTWAWKDEDELAEAVERGLFTEEDTAWFRYWGERAVEHVLLREPPFDEDWTDWRPDPAWQDPVLPADWDLVPA
jgi:uncharacterized protein